MSHYLVQLCMVSFDGQEEQLWLPADQTVNGATVLRKKGLNKGVITQVTDRVMSVESTDMTGMKIIAPHPSL